MSNRYWTNLQTVQENPALKEGLRVFSYAGVCMSAYCLLYLCVSWLSEDVWLLVKGLTFLFVPFVLLSLFRRWVDAPRPYDVYPDLFSDRPKKSDGSFPSRHAFCAFAIGTLGVAFVPAVGGLTLAFALGMSVSRVYLGLHFGKDVLVGGGFGCLSGGVALLILTCM